MMYFTALQKQYFNSRGKKTALIFTGILGLILVTPLCGFLFDCGCTWSWSGLDSKYNFHMQNAVHNCPWCASWIASWLSVGVSIASGVLVAASPLPWVTDRVRNESLIRILLGTVTFLSVAVIASWLAAAQQNYQLGILGINQEYRRDLNSWLHLRSGLSSGNQLREVAKI
jgi:hypothetical protein